MPVPESRRRLALASALLILAAILAVTSWPSGDASPKGGWVACLLCQERRLADAILNVILFTPLGVAMAAAGWRVGRIVRWSLLLSLSIELLQFFVPGRYPDVVDLFTNAAGGALGGWLAVHATAWIRARGAPRRLWFSVAAAPVLVAFTGWALGPAWNRPAFAHWRPDFSSLEQWSGTVLSARVGERPIEAGRVVDPDGLRADLARGAPLQVTGIAGRPTARMSSIVSITDPRQRDVVLLGPVGEDLIWIQRRRADDLFLDAPPIRFERALSGVAPGSPLSIMVEQLGGRTCLTVNDQRDCAPRFASASLWSILYAATLWRAPMRRMLDLLTFAALVLPATLLLRAVPVATAGSAMLVLAAGVIGAASWSGLQPPAWSESLGAGLGIALGLTLSHPRFHR